MFISGGSLEGSSSYNFLELSSSLQYTSGEFWGVYSSIHIFTFCTILRSSTSLSSFISSSNLFIEILGLSLLHAFVWEYVCSSNIWKCAESWRSSKSGSFYFADLLYPLGIQCMWWWVDQLNSRRIHIPPWKRYECCSNVEHNVYGRGTYLHCHVVFSWLLMLICYAYWLQGLSPMLKWWIHWLRLHYYFFYDYICSSLVNGILRALQTTQALPTYSSASS